MSRDSLKTLAESQHFAPIGIGILAVICIVIGVVLGLVLS
jgi:hypothetical protein